RLALFRQSPDLICRHHLCRRKRSRTRGVGQTEVYRDMSLAPVVRTVPRRFAAAGGSKRATYPPPPRSCICLEQDSEIHRCRWNTGFLWVVRTIGVQIGENTSFDVSVIASQ